MNTVSFGACEHSRLAYMNTTGGATCIDCRAYFAMGSPEEKRAEQAYEQAAAPVSVPPEGIAAPRLAGPVDYERVMKVMPQHCPHRDRDGLVCQPCAYSTITALFSQLEAAGKERDEALARAEQAERKHDDHARRRTMEMCADPPVPHRNDGEK